MRKENSNKKEYRSHNGVRERSLRFSCTPIGSRSTTTTTTTTTHVQLISVHAVQQTKEKHIANRVRTAQE